MNFLLKLGIVFSIFLTIIIYDYQSYDIQTRNGELGFMNGYSIIKPNFIFISDDYKEFIYVK